MNLSGKTPIQDYSDKYNSALYIINTVYVNISRENIRLKMIRLFNFILSLSQFL